MSSGGSSLQSSSPRQSPGRGDDEVTRYAMKFTLFGSTVLSVGPTFQISLRTHTQVKPLIFRLQLEEKIKDNT